jgi:hypothetical protein
MNPDAARRFAFELSHDRLIDVHALLLRDGRRRAADDLRAFAAVAGIRLPARGDVSPDRTAPDKDAAEFVRSGDTVVPRAAAATFYVDDAVLHLLSGLDTARLPFRDRMLAQSLRGTAARDAAAAVAWMRWYLVRAVAHELRGYGRRGAAVSVPNADVLVADSPAEDVLGFLAAAEACFRHGDWMREYGGSAWAEIASTAYALWATPGAPRPLIDRVFDLEHNHGAVFDKVPRRVHEDNGLLKKVLDAKYAAPRPEDFLASLPSDIIPADLLAELRDRLRLARRLSGRS